MCRFLGIFCICFLQIRTVLFLLFLFCMSLISFSCLKALSRNISIVLNKSSESEHSCLVLILGVSIQSFIIEYNVSHRILQMLFMKLQKFSTPIF